MLSFENFVKSMPPSLSELKVTPSFCFAFKIPDDMAASNIELGKTYLLLVFWQSLRSHVDGKAFRPCHFCLFTSWFVNKYSFKIYFPQEKNYPENTNDLESCFSLLLRSFSSLAYLTVVEYRTGANC